MSKSNVLSVFFRNFLQPVSITLSLFLLFLSSNTFAVITAAKITELSAPSMDKASLSLTKTDEPVSGIVSQQYSFLYNHSVLAESGFQASGTEGTLESFCRDVTLLKHSQWAGDTLILVLNSSDGCAGHLQPEKVYTALLELLGHEVLGKTFALATISNLLPEVAMCGSEAITKALAKMQNAWSLIQRRDDDENAKKMPEMQIIAALRALIDLLASQHSISPKHIWIAGYQPFGRVALLARAIPSVDRVIPIAYERSGLTNGLKRVIGSGQVKEGLRAVAKAVINNTQEEGSSFWDNIPGVKQVRAGAKRLLSSSEKPVLLALLEQLEDEERAQFILEVTQPYHWHAPDVVEFSMLCTHFLENLEEPAGVDGEHRADFRIYVQKQEGDLDERDVIEALRCSMLQKLTELKAPYDLKQTSSWGFTRTARVKIPKQDPTFARISLMGKTKGATPLPDPVNNSIFKEESSDGSCRVYQSEFDKGIYPIYVDGHYEYEGVQGRLSSQLLPIDSY
ncbi:hypothetical protein [Spongorhabdus nitratireducens]